MALYPAQIDNNQSLPIAINNNSPTPGAIFNRLRDAVLQIETELGIKPSSLYGSVQERFSYLENIIGNLKLIKVNGDLGGSPEEPKIIKLQGRPLSDIMPTLKQLIAWNGIAWAPQNIDYLLPQANFSGQIMMWNGSSWIAETVNFLPEASAVNQVVIWNGSSWIAETVNFLPEASVINQVVIWDGSNWGAKTMNFLPDANTMSQTAIWDGTTYIADQLTQDDILPGYKFEILRDTDKFLTVGQEKEIYFFVDYDTNPELVLVTNNEDMNEQDATNSVITDKKIITNNAYVKNNFNESITFNLSVTKNRSHKIYSHNIIWGQPLFWGVGDASTFSGSFSDFLNSLTGTIVTNTINHNFYITAPALQKVYFACRSGYGNALFNLNGLYGGFTKIRSSIAFENAYAFTEPFDLYESDSAGLGNVIVTVSTSPF